jgi:hypothetical protein
VAPSPSPGLRKLHSVSLRRLLSHIAAGAFFALLAIVWSWPLAAHLPTHLPGNGVGDNVSFLWNVWWMRRVLDNPGLTFFTSDRLFAPYGFDLTLHTHAALPSFLSATLAGHGLMTAENVVLLVSLALNGWLAYLLAWDRTGDRGASLVAGIVFGGSPYLFTHLLGHFNLIAAWGLPLFLVCLLRARDRGHAGWGAAAGMAAIAIAYTDYYYLVYCAALTVGVIGWPLLPWRVDWRRAAPSPGARRALLILLAIDAAIVAAVLSTGGFEAQLFGVRISAHRATNLLSLGWVLLAALTLLARRPGLQARTIDRRVSRHHLRIAGVVLGVVVVGVAPLLAHGIALWRAGDYTAPTPSWRSGPAGVDLMTVALGNPMHPLSGAVTRRVYDRLGIDHIEGVAWMGVVPLVLAGWAARRDRRHRETRLWLAIAAVFFVWALGPWLKIGGFDTGLLLPQNLAARVPILSNARVPGRAMAVVMLAVAMLCARAIAAAPRRRLLLALGAGVLIAVDYLPAPYPLVQLRIPALYADILAAGGDDVVCELPVGVRDGFGSIGRFDDETLFFQMVHEHRLLGGFAARVPARIKTGYLQRPVIRSLFRLSGGGAIDPADAAVSPSDAARALRDAGIRFVVLNRQTALPQLTSYVERSLPLVLARQDGPRDLYIVSEDALPPGSPAR